MKVIIAGGRFFDDYLSLKRFCDKILINQENVEVVSGKAKGADSLGEMYARERGYPVKEFPANWGRYKKSAGYIRNAEMAEYADALIAFWDGSSKGTSHMINLAKEKGLKVRIFNYEGWTSN